MAVHKKSQPVIFFYIAIWLFICSELIVVYAQDSSDEQGIYVSHLQKTLDTLETDNTERALLIYKYESLQTIASEAASLGFVKTNELYLLR